MIPARMGSKRITKKNIRFLNGKPLINYVFEAAKNSNCFDEIYVNSESDLIGELAISHGLSFYKRPQQLSTDSATNDHFVQDFITNIQCDILVQILPTSPFISSKDIKDFTDKMLHTKCDALISVKNEQIECVYDKRAINFDPLKPSPPSQELKPVQPYACSLMGWEVGSYKTNMEKFGSGYHGGNAKKEYFILKGFSTIDIDNEEDFQLAETIARHITKSTIHEKRYYDDPESVEVDVKSILKKDGVAENELDLANSEIPVKIKDIRKKFNPNSSWSYRVVNTENNSATLIHQLPGEGNRAHYHSDWNEWWYIIDGKWEWNIEGEKIIVEKDDIVFIPKNKIHHITAVGNSPAVRLAVSREDVGHIYPERE